MALPLSDYVLALEAELIALEVNIPQLIMSQAARTVLTKIKEESAKVV